MQRFLWVAGALLATCLSSFALQAQSNEYYTADIEIVGNETYSNQEIERLMKLKKTVIRRRPFSRRALKVDALTVRNYYNSAGFLEATVIDSYVVSSDGGVVALLRVVEGPRYFLAEIQVTGNRSIPTDDIRKLLRLKNGDPFDPLLLGDRLRALRDRYQDMGKLAIDILEEREVQENSEVTLRLLISEGVTYRVGNVLITGLNKVPERYVTRELLLKPGMTFSRRDLLRSQRRIFETGWFSSAEIVPQVRSLEQGVADIEVHVRELHQRSLDLAFGFSQTPSALPGGEPTSALTATGQWWKSSVWNTSNRLGLTLGSGLNLKDLTIPEYTAAIELVIPWVFRLRVPSSVRFFTERLTTPNVIRRNGIELSFFSRRLQRTRVRGALEWVRIIPKDPSGKVRIQRSVRLDYRFWTVDNILEPHRGVYLLVKPSLHGTQQTEVPYYYKLEVDYRRYRPLVGPVVFAYRLKGGYLETLPAGKGAQLGRYNLFNLGGSTSLRGWENPDDFPTANDKGRGVIKGLVNLELRFPLFWILGGEVFADGGALQLRGGGSGRYQGWDVGAGLVVATPLGPVRIDVAFKQGKEWTGNPILQVAFLHTF